eukprot:5894978-Lingulodinium_polyedra.AAC.1
MAGMTCPSSSPCMKGHSPEHMANVMTPKAHESAELSTTGLPAHCSGERAYPVVTGREPNSERALCAVPRSHSFAQWCSSTRTFLSETSTWTTPWAC